MTKEALAEIYRSYTACLNRQDWPQPGQAQSGSEAPSDDDRDRRDRGSEWDSGH